MRQLTTTLVVVLAMVAITATAAEPTGYYSAAENKTKQGLLTALYNIIHEHTKIDYDDLWDAYLTTDTGSDGYLLDMYSTAKYKTGDKCGNYSAVGDCVNREHSFPKSWWGSTKDEKYSDIFHLYPTDGYVNNQRSNYPFGVCAGGTRVPDANGAHALGKKGTSTYNGYSGIVFEPDDMYKGDFARTYFYMATCYNNQIANWSSDMLAGNNYPVFSTWALNMLLEWHRNDPVSEKEIKRNDAAYACQDNRNPFIDHPELAEYIWGNKMGTNWTLNASADPNPVLLSPNDVSTIDMGVVAINTSKQVTITVKGKDLSKELALSVTNSAFILNKSSITAANANAGTTLTITYNAPATAQNTAATLIITSDEVSTRVPLTAQTVSGIPAQAASEITQSSFQANWTNVGGATSYTLSVLEADGTTMVNGYPVSVNASDETYLVTGLNANSKYYYRLSGGSMTSNVIEVTTLDNASIISLQTAESFTLTGMVGTLNPVLEALVYTEWVEEDIELTVSGNFEISLDKQNWSQALTIDKDGETFYIRFKSIDQAGEFDGILSASTLTLSGATEEITGVILSNEQESVIEDWEGCTTGGYWDKEVQGHLYLWRFNNAGIWNQTSDKYHGTLSCRFGKNSTSSITMLEDKENGVSMVSFWAAKFGSDANAIITLSYSADGGQHWVEIEDFNINSTELTQYTSRNLNVPGDVRIKLQQVEGARLNIDDIEITDFTTATIIDIVKDKQSLTWDAYCSKGNLIIESDNAQRFEIYNLEAKLVKKMRTNGRTSISLPAGIYVVVSGNHSKKVIIK